MKQLTFEKTQNDWATHFPVALNGAVEMYPFFQDLRNSCGAESLIETGTWAGESAAAFSTIFPSVHTIELDKTRFALSQKRLATFSNVSCHFGHSPQVLHTLLPALKGEKIVAYLDAHGSGLSAWPLLFELRELAKTHRNNVCVVIDDFQVPGRPDIPFDSYEGHSCSLPYIQQDLLALFPDGHNAALLIPQNAGHKAKFVACPTAWPSKWLQ